LPYSGGKIMKKTKLRNIEEKGEQERARQLALSDQRGRKGRIGKNIRSRRGL